MPAQYHLYLITLLFGLYFAVVALKVAHFLQDHCGITERCHDAGALALSLIFICFGCKCQLNACKVKIQKLCSRHAQIGAKQTDELKLSKEQGLFFLSFFPPVSVMFSLHQNPLAIVQRQAASLHMFGYCSITLLLPPAHSFNRPCWLACYIKTISTVISINPTQPCKILIYCKDGSTAGSFGS